MTTSLLKHTTGVCPHCLTKVPAEVRAEAGEVHIVKMCAEHGESRGLLATNQDFYYEGPGLDASTCGPGGCAWTNHSCTLMFEITQGCNLTCPTCFTASTPEHAYRLSRADFETQLDALRAGGKTTADIIQISGGEPTIHPEFLDIIDAAFERDLRFVFVNSNGIELGRRPEMWDRLRAYAGRLQIYLQFDGLRSSTFGAIRGAKGLLDYKLKALDYAAEAGVHVLPVMTVTPGINDDEVGDVIRMAWERHPAVKGVMLQPAMYAGRYENEQTPRRLTVGDVARAVGEQTDGFFAASDFGPIPCSDPNCFSMAVGLVNQGKMLPISRYFPHYSEWSKPGAAERLGPLTNKLPMNMLDAVAEDAVVDQLLDLLAADEDSTYLRDFQNFFVVSIKPFMDAHTYDQDRVDKCCTHVVDRSGRPVSLCEYNTLRRPRGLE